MIHINKIEGLYGFREHVYIRAVNNVYLKYNKLEVINVHRLCFIALEWVDTPRSTVEKLLFFPVMLVVWFKSTVNVLKGEQCWQICAIS